MIDMLSSLPKADFCGRGGEQKIDLLFFSSFTILLRWWVLVGVYFRVRGWIRDRGGFRDRGEFRV